jgi:hypothetical protein
MTLGQRLSFVSVVVFFLSALPLSVTHAINFEKLTCASVPNTKRNTYNVEVACTATVRRTGTARWHQAVAQHCPTFCGNMGGYNALSPDGFRCVSGETRGRSSIGAIDFSPTGCWHSCSAPEGNAGSESVGHRCYSPRQKRDNDRTDTTVGCYCVVGDTGAQPVEVAINAGGTATVSASNYRLTGWESVARSARNDRPNRMINVVGIVPLGQTSTIDLSLKVEGACGTAVQVSGSIAHSNNRLEQSGIYSIALPACVPQCNDGVDNDGDGAVDYPAEAACSSADDNDEGDIKTACQDGVDNDKDGAADYPNDFSCSSTQDLDEGNPKSQCQNGIDDDKDGVTDSFDPGCANNQDNNEGDKTTACQDKADNDGDGATDYPADVGCRSATDNNEGDFKAQCQDGVDNDADGESDYPEDKGCESPQDYSEADPVTLKITPIAECVELKQDGSLVARFGYRNDGTSAVDVAVGAQNYFTPGALDRAQPRTFLVGRVTNLFTVSFSSSEKLQWVVGGSVASASIATERCQASNLGCVDTDNTKALAALDGVSRGQRTNVMRLTRRVLRIQSTGPLADKAQSYREVAHSIYLEQWASIWGSFPKVSKNCSSCAAVDMRGEISGVTNRAQRLLRLARQAAALLKQARRGNLRVDEQQLVADTENLYNRFADLSQGLPRFESKCN